MTVGCAVRGILTATLAAAQAGFTRAIVPLAQPGEAQLVEGIEVFGVASLGQLAALCNNEPVPFVEPIEVAGEYYQTNGHTDTRPLSECDAVGLLARQKSPGPL